jgi:Contractile injection system tube protein
MTAEIASLPASQGIGTAATTGDSVAVQLIRATLAELPSMPPPEDFNPLPLEFDFNPEKITITHNQKISGASTQGDRQTQIDNLGQTNISIDKIIFTGLTTQMKCQRLLDWSTSMVETVGESMVATPKLAFIWGAAFYYEVLIRDLTVNYVRFAASGNPTRAEVSLKMYQNDSPAPSQNPTSGGPPGRGSHVLDSSGCLASVAYTTYDRPGAWRLIARANAIDDPLRVRPGTRLYLPQRAEPEREPGAKR